VLLANNAESFVIESVKKSTVLVLAWEPIDEPMVHYGPFVMNTKAEIWEAMNDFRRGKFGELED
jgi:redox-sensitive bicupin YhaK (pirin superfamily)